MTRRRALELQTDPHISSASDSEPERPISQSNSRETTQQADAMHRALFPEYENYGNHHLYGRWSGDARPPSPVIGEDLPAGPDGLTSLQEDHVQQSDPPGFGTSSDLLEHLRQEFPDFVPSRNHVTSHFGRPIGSIDQDIPTGQGIPWATDEAVTYEAFSPNVNQHQPPVRRRVTFIRREREPELSPMVEVSSPLEDVSPDIPTSIARPESPMPWRPTPTCNMGGWRPTTPNIPRSWGVSPSPWDAPGHAAPPYNNDVGIVDLFSQITLDNQPSAEQLSRLPPTTEQRSQRPCRHCHSTLHRSRQCTTRPTQISQLIANRQPSSYSQQQQDYLTHSVLPVQSQSIVLPPRELVVTSAQMVQSAVQPLGTYSQGWGAANHTNLPRHEAQPNLIDHQTTMLHDVPVGRTGHTRHIAINEAIGYTGATGGISFNDMTGQLGRIDHIHPQEPQGQWNQNGYPSHIDRPATRAPTSHTVTIGRLAYDYDPRESDCVGKEVPGMWS